MEWNGEPRGETLPVEAKKPPKYTREMLFLAEQAAEGGLKILPGHDWALHYPVDPQVRAEKLQGLLDGTYTAEEVAHDITPDALFYNPEDIDQQGLEQVSAKIRDLSASIAYHDFPRFARFVESMRGCDIPLHELDTVYSGIVQTRIQKRLLDAYGPTGRKQIETTLRGETTDALKGMEGLSRSQRVLKALKMDWLCDDRGLISTQERDQIVATLSGDERKLFQDLQSSYREYIQKGDEKGYQGLVEGVHDGLPKIQQDTKPGEQSESMQELEQELEPFMDKAGLPGTPEDPAIPPDDSDEYHTPPIAPGESREQSATRPIFEIEPPLGGYYASGRKSHYDIDTKTWSKKKQLSPYGDSPSVEEHHSISGALDAGIKSLPLPTGYRLDVSSLRFTGDRPDIFRDQNGCFYLEAKGPGTFSIDFVPEQTPFTSAPIPEDTSPLYQGHLSGKTETQIARLTGGALQKAEQARQYLLANHFYPGGGDLQAAQALQYKIRTESTGDTYLQSLDASEYLECYSAHTLFIAMMRKSGVPARLVIGHKVEGAKDGKSVIDQSTGHAWAEIWDGKAWRRIDATPNPKPEDKKEEKGGQKSDKKESAPEADDGGIERPQDKSPKDEKDKRPKGEKGNDKSEKAETEADESGQPSEKKGGQSKAETDQTETGTDETEQSETGADENGQPSKETGQPTDQLSDASDSDVQEAESQLAEAKEKMAQMTEQKKQFDEKIQQTEKFKELADLKKELEKSELLDDMLKELEEKLASKEDQMKDKIKEDLDTMVDDGFLDEQRREQLEEMLNQQQLEELDRLQQQIEEENALYNEYDEIRERVQPLVEKWFKYFAERLPKQEEIDIDDDTLTRQGAFNRRSVMKPRNLLFGTVKNPREFRPEIKPRFMASILVDVSGSMDQGNKLRNARELLVFYSELFSRISSEFGYIRFSIDIFSDSVTNIKAFDQDYDSPQRYDFSDGESSTIKVRLMRRLHTQGGTNMLDGIKRAAEKLNKEAEDFPDYASAFYFVGDGGDTCGNAQNIKTFLTTNDKEHGFGEHMFSAILMGDESQRQELAGIFGDEHTSVAPDLDQLIEQSMDKFDGDIEEYLRTMTL